MPACRATAAQGGDNHGLPLDQHICHHPDQEENDGEGQEQQEGDRDAPAFGRIVEVLSGMPYEKFLEERIFRPLGMKDSYIYPPAEKYDRIPTAYILKDGKPEKLEDLKEGEQVGLLRLGEMERPDHVRPARSWDAAAVIQVDHLGQRPHRSIVHVRAVLGHAAKRGCLESVSQLLRTREVLTAADIVAGGDPDIVK